MLEPPYSIQRLEIRFFLNRNKNNKKTFPPYNFYSPKHFIARLCRELKGSSNLHFAQPNLQKRSQKQPRKQLIDIFTFWLTRGFVLTLGDLYLKGQGKRQKKYTKTDLRILIQIQITLNLPGHSMKLTKKGRKNQSFQW